VEERGWAYRRRQPEGTVPCEAVKDNLATLLEEASEVGAACPGTWRGTSPDTWSAECWRP